MTPSASGAILQLRLRHYFLALLLLPMAGCATSPSGETRAGRAQQGGDRMIREPAVANQFYPARKDSLSGFLDRTLLQTPKPDIPGPVMGIAVPHAGYPYSGPTAAYAYQALAGLKPKTVVLLGPSHHAAFSGFAVYARGAWKTPLGLVNVDEEFAAALIKRSKLIKDEPHAHDQEHSLEVQLPFLQKTLTDFKIVPIEIAFADFAQLQELGHSLAKVARGRDVLLLASSDLYHGNSYGECEQTDSVTLSYLERFDPKGFYDALTAQSAQACGGLPLTALMLALKEMGAAGAKVVARTNSNDVTGERGGYCVGYGAVVFYREAAKAPPSDGALLKKSEQQELLHIAWTTLESTVYAHPVPKFAAATERLNEHRGVFVTLKKRGDLRGCIGYIEGFKPLYQAVRDMTIAAATEDYRFGPVEPGELKDIDIEITVLTPLERCPDPEHTIELGKHGIVVKSGGRQGVFLPQVATETGWDVQTFLSQCCAQKAGLAPDAWRDKGTEVYTFCGQVFGAQD